MSISSTRSIPARPDPAERLAAFVRGLAAPAMAERSVKLVPGALLSMRWLMSVAAADLAPADREAALALATELGLAEPLAAMLRDDLASAAILHFGAEGGEDGTVLKLYAEFPEQRRGGGKRLVHRAVKWRPHRPEAGGVARYLADPALSGAAVAARIAELFGDRSDEPPARLVLSLYNRARGRASADDLLLLEVEEEGTPRRSFDVKFYDAGFRLADLAASLPALAAHFALPPADAAALAALPAEAALGHLAGGIGRDGRAFLTLYFGGGPA